MAPSPTASPGQSNSQGSGAASAHPHPHLWNRLAHRPAFSFSCKFFPSQPVRQHRHHQQGLVLAPRAPLLCRVGARAKARVLQAGTQLHFPTSPLFQKRQKPCLLNSPGFVHFFSFPRFFFPSHLFFIPLHFQRSLLLVFAVSTQGGSCLLSEPRELLPF